MSTWNDVDAGGGSSLLPSGEYEAVVAGAVIVTDYKKKDGNPGKPFVDWTFDIQGDLHGGRKVWTKNYLVEGALGMLKGNLSALELSGELDGVALDDYDALGLVLQKSLEKSVLLNVKVSGGNGYQERNEARVMQLIDGAGVANAVTSSDIPF